MGICAGGYKTCVILNTGQNFLIVDIKLAEYDYKAIKVMIVGDKKWENLNIY